MIRGGKLKKIKYAAARFIAHKNGCRKRITGK